MALELDIHYSTFDDWQNNNPEFSDAVKAAEKISQGWWEREGRKATFGGCEGFNATSYIFNMKNRFKDDWRDKQEQDVNHGVQDSLSALLTEVDGRSKGIPNG